MIVLDNISKCYRVNRSRVQVADQMSGVFPTGKTVAVMGHNGSGKSTLLQMIAGAIDPDEGTIERHGTVSWPVGFRGAFHVELTAAQNVRFVGRLYGVDTEELIHFVKDFTQLGKHFHSPVKNYSSGMRSRLSFGLSMGIPFDTYLIDEVSSVGDAAFKERAAAILHDRLSTYGAVVVTHSKRLVRQICESAYILRDGRLTHYEDVEEAIEVHVAKMKGA